MKKTIILSVALAFATFGAFAQESNGGGQMQSHGTPEERAKRQADGINATAKLTPDQYNKVLAITKDFAAKKDALKASGASGDEVKTKFKALREQEDAQIKAVLTADQYAKLQAARKEHQAPKGE